MRKVLMFMMESCPYCRQALQWMEELRMEDQKYHGVEVTIIDENLHPDIAGHYDYYYVPAYFINKLNVHEGIPSKEIVRSVFEKTLLA